MWCRVVVIGVNGLVKARSCDGNTEGEEVDVELAVAKRANQGYEHAKGEHYEATHLPPFFDVKVGEPVVHLGKLCR